MPEITPFIAASPGALKHLQQNPMLQKALKQGIFKDIWGSEFSTFMGMDDQSSGEVPENAQGHNQAFSSDVSIYRCVDLRGAAIASVPLKVFDQLDPDLRKEVDHDAMGVLASTNPFGYVAGPGLMRYSLGSRDLHGSFAWRIISDQGGPLRSSLPRELYWMPPAQYKPVAGRDLDPPQPKLPFAGLKVREEGREVLIPANQVVYAPTYNPTDPLRGTSKITALRDDLNLRLYGQASNLWFFRNNQRPDVLVTGAFNPTPENVGLMRRIWQAAFGGENARGPAFLPHDMSVHLLTMAAKDAEWLGQRQVAREDILAAFGVPPPVYGDLSRATYENIRTAYEGFWRSGMIPELDEIAWVLTQQFLWKWPDAQKAKLVFCFDYTQIEALQEDANAVWERTTALMDRLLKAVELRTMLPDQFRVAATTLFKMAGLPSEVWAGTVPGGQMFYARLQEIPITEASVQANVDVNSARAGITNGETNHPGDGQWILPKQQMAPTAGPGGPAQAGGQPPLPQQQARKALGPPSPPPDPIPIRELRLRHVIDWLWRRFKRYFQDQQTIALRNLRHLQLPNAQLEAWIMAAADRLWDRDQAREAAALLVREAAAMSYDVAYGAAREEYRLPVQWVTNDDLIAKYLGRRLHLIQNIDDTTREMIREALGAGIAKGEGMPELSRRVRDVFAYAIDHRAMTIARTETIQAYGHASIASYREAGLVKARMFDGPNADSADCISVDGQEVSLDEAERLMDAEHPNGTRAVAPIVPALQETAA